MSHDKEKYIGYIEMCMGTGEMVGPALGGLMYESCNYFGTFLLFSHVTLAGMVVSDYLVPE